MPPRKATSSTAKAAKTAPAKRAPSKRKAPVKPKAAPAKTALAKPKSKTQTKPAAKSAKAPATKPKPKKKADSDSDDSASSDGSESGSESGSSSESELDEEGETDNDDDVDEIETDDGEDSDFSTYPSKKKPRTSKASPAKRKPAKKSIIPARSPSPSPPPPPRFNEEYGSIDILPLEVIMLVSEFIERRYLPIVQLAAVSKSLRQRLLPFLYERVFYACNWDDLHGASDHFRTSIRQLHLLRPHTLLYADDRGPLADKRKPQSVIDKPSLLPNLRLLKLTASDNLKSGETMGLSVAAFSIAASTVAREAPALQAIESALELGATMPHAAHANTKLAWQPPSVIAGSKKGRRKGKRQDGEEKEDEEGKKKWPAPDPVTQLMSVQFTLDVDNAILRSKVFRTLFESLAFIDTLVILDLRLTIKHNVDMRCSGGVNYGYWMPRRCRLRYLVAALEPLKNLRGLRLVWSRTPDGPGESCFFNHLLESAEFKSLEKLEFPVRLSGLKTLSNELRGWGADKSQGRKLDEVIFRFQDYACPALGEGFAEHSPLDRARPWASNFFRKIPSLQRITGESGGVHWCGNPHNAAGLSQCYQHGIDFARAQVLGMEVDEAKKEGESQAAPRLSPPK